MAQYDIILTQNVHATLVEYSEKFVNIDKGDLLSANSSQVPTVLAAGTDGYMLVRDDAETTGLKWQQIAAGHTQNTDTGTDSTVFELDNDGYKIELTAESATKFGVKQDGGATYADMEAKDATFAKVTVSAAPSAGSDLCNKTYVDGVLGANDAMVFKGAIDCSGNPNYPAADAGDTYKVSVAGKIGGASGPDVEVGDTLYCTNDSTSTGDHATVGAYWVILQVNLDGAVIGPTSSTDGYFAIWDGTSGALLKNGAGAPGTMAYETATDYVTKALFNAYTILYADTDDTPAPLTVGASTFVGRKASGGIVALTASEAKTILGITVSDISDIGTYYVAKATFDANTILKADSDDTPTALTVAEERIVGRITSGSIAALTGVQVMNIIWSSAPAAYNSTGTAGEIAYDEDYLYVCVATNTWVRTPLALNWT